MRGLGVERFRGLGFTSGLGRRFVGTILQLASPHLPRVPLHLSSMGVSEIRGLGFRV